MRYLLIHLIVVTCSAAAFSQTSSQNTWSVRLANDAETSLSVVAGSQDFQIRNGDTLQMTIPMGGVTGIYHMTHPVPRLRTCDEIFWSNCSVESQNTLTSTLLRGMTSPLRASRRHFVEIRWYANRDGVIVLEVNKDQYLPFLNWLERNSGLRWLDIDEERERLLNEIEQSAGSAFPATVDYRSTDLADRWITRSYWGLFVERQGGSELLFFAGPVRPKNLVAILPVKPEWSDNTCAVSSTQTLYHDCGNAACGLEAILLPTVTYRVLSPPTTRTVDASGKNESDCSKLAIQRKRRQELAADPSTAMRPTLKREQD